MKHITKYVGLIVFSFLCVCQVSYGMRFFPQGLSELDRGERIPTQLSEWMQYHKNGMWLNPDFYNPIINSNYNYYISSLSKKYKLEWNSNNNTFRVSQINAPKCVYATQIFGEKPGWLFSADEKYLILFWHIATGLEVSIVNLHDLGKYNRKNEPVCPIVFSKIFDGYDIKGCVCSASYFVLQLQERIRVQHEEVYNLNLIGNINHSSGHSLVQEIPSVMFPGATIKRKKPIEPVKDEKIVVFDVKNAKRINEIFKENATGESLISRLDGKYLTMYTNYSYGNLKGAKIKGIDLEQCVAAIEKRKRCTCFHSAKPCGFCGKCKCCHMAEPPCVDCKKRLDDCCKCDKYFDCHIVNILPIHSSHASYCGFLMFFYEDNSISIFDIGDTYKEAVIHSVDRNVNIGPSADHRFLIFSSNDKKTIKIFDIADRFQMIFNRSFEGPVNFCSVSEDKKTIRLKPVGKEKEESHTFCTYSQIPQHVISNGNEFLVLSSNNNKTIKIFDVTNNLPITFRQDTRGLYTKTFDKAYKKIFNKTFKKEVRHVSVSPGKNFITVWVAGEKEGRIFDAPISMKREPLFMTQVLSVSENRTFPEDLNSRVNIGEPTDRTYTIPKSNRQLAQIRISDFVLCDSRMYRVMEKVTNNTIRNGDRLLSQKQNDTNMTGKKRKRDEDDKDGKKQKKQKIKL